MSHVRDQCSEVCPGLGPSHFFPPLGTHLRPPPCTRPQGNPSAGRGDTGPRSGGRQPGPALGPLGGPRRTYPGCRPCRRPRPPSCSAAAGRPPRRSGPPGGRRPSPPRQGKARSPAWRDRGHLTRGPHGRRQGDPLRCLHDRPRTPTVCPAVKAPENKQNQTSPFQGASPAAGARSRGWDRRSGSQPPGKTSSWAACKAQPQMPSPRPPWRPA